MKSCFGGKSCLVLKPRHLLQEYFSDDLAPLAGEELEKTFKRKCADCNVELEALLTSQISLQQWQDQASPSLGSWSGII